MTSNGCAVRLADLSRGESAVVEAYEGHAELGRFESMGLRLGAMVTMLMPGSPCALAVEETRLMISREILERVVVSPL